MAFPAALTRNVFLSAARETLVNSLSFIGRTRMADIDFHQVVHLSRVRLNMASPQSVSMNCLELSGGRLNCERSYELPGFSLLVSSRTHGALEHGGGEVHYLSSCASGRITRLILSDICGQRQTFREISTVMRDGLLQHINSLWQGNLVKQLHQQLESFAETGGFASASLCTFFAPTRSFTMCSLGNPPPIWFDSQQRTWKRLSPLPRRSVSVPKNGAAAGVYQLDEYQHFQQKTRPGDLLLVYGNGFSESRFADGTLAGGSELLYRLQAMKDVEGIASIEPLISEIQRGGLSGDSTVIIAEANRRVATIRNTLLAPIRMLRSPRDCSSVE